MALRVRAISPSSARVSLICCWNSVAAKPSERSNISYPTEPLAGKPDLGQAQPCIRDLIRGHQDLAAIAGNAIGDVLALKLVHDLRRIAQVKVAVEQRHGFRAAVQHHQCQHAEHPERDCPHCGESSRAQGT